MSAGPLDGVVVLDLSRVLAGPYCTMILGDMGADVIKVEHPDGDETRRWGPPFAAGESAYYLAVNRNKRSVTLNLDVAEDRELVRRIAARADVLIENFLPGALDRRGLNLTELREANPRLITVSISGMGASGPESKTPGYDFIVQAASGLMSITGPADGEPHKLGVAIVDLTTGMMAANAILAALYAREKAGVGQHIETSLFETALSWLANVGQSYLITGDSPRRHGNAHPTIVPYQTFATSDATIALGVGTDAQWKRLCSAIARPDLGDDSRYTTNPGRVQHRTELTAQLAATFATQSADAWTERIRAAGIPVSKVRSVDEALQDVQTAAREMVVAVQHPLIGELRLLGTPWKFSETAASIRRPPPLLGEHNDEVRQEYNPG